MQDENLHKVVLQKPERKEANTILKTSFSCLASYLTGSRHNPSASPTTELEESVVSTAVQGELTASRCPSPTRELIELAEKNALTAGLSVSTATTSMANSETQNTTPKVTSPCRDTASSSSSTSALQASMHTHIQHPILQPTDYLSPSTSTDERDESHSTNITITTPDQKRNIQEIFIKSLISKLTKERREAKMKLRTSRRIRYLAAVNKIVRRGWSGRPHVMMGSRLGRKRKLDEQCT
ncbi:d987240e-c4f8-4dc8-b575-b4d47af2371f [Sclerotinia trifoliorum]|uniref:D987240e-c4f8-4dc8-b575-b4d47af2371f n=1 Tax=Sclerotinia trifoliorum TaxID=28548 RepID=A0A8H2W3Z8_9HELO|nr:d987240e-c4f8-4dc8-b575-b4d47af2371f [Sclerotinia trifoliorum]